MVRSEFYLPMYTNETRQFLLPSDFLILSFFKNSISVSYFFNTLTYSFVSFFTLMPNISTVLSSFMTYIGDIFTGVFFKSIFNVVALNAGSMSVFFYGDRALIVSAPKDSSLLFLSKNLSTKDSINNFSFTEHSSAQRSTRFSNSLIGYDYKTGHYLGSSEVFYPQLLLSFIEVARGIRKPSWVFSDQYIDLLNQNYKRFYANFTGKINLKLTHSDD